jgi:hypothetical protein
MWMSTSGGGLAVVAYGPSQVTATIRGGVVVTITEATEYPFRESIRLTVSPSKPAVFPLELRVPTWAETASVRVNGRAAAGVKAGTFHKIERTWKQGDRVELLFPMKPRISRWYNNSVAVHRGPLLYSLQIGENWRKYKDRPQAPDWEIQPATAWNYGLVVDGRDPARSFQVEERLVGQYPFSAEGAPVRLKVKARRVPEWTMKNNSAAPPPQSPVTSAEPEETVLLIPYGSAKLRITEFPAVVVSGKGAKR